MFLKAKNRKRNFLGVVFIILLLIGSIFSTYAGNLKLKAQVPGYYRINLGQFQITALLDGTSPLAQEMLFGISEAEKEELLSRMFITGDIPSGVNAYLINTGSKLVLVDAGAGNSFGSMLGHLPESLKAAGYRPCQIDAILITHAHPDHIAGLLNSKDKPVFPKATVYISMQEAAFWLSSENEANAPEAALPIFQLMKKTEAIFSARNQWITFNDGDSPIPEIQEIKAILTPGHSPGMAAFEVTSDDQKLLIWGDVVHVTAVQMPRPFTFFGYDLDPLGAAVTRLAQLEMAAAEKTFVAGSHLDFPGFGHVRQEDFQSFAWVPVYFSTLLE